MLIREGKNAVNIITDRWIYVQEDVNLEIDQEIILGNGKKYKVVGFIEDKYVKVV
ncbi:hypothetical protein GCM10023310_70520 [Paenibacillus vulneris]|uniref:Uncharacterized protein n=1 Tax=Paenibacillus vulneris TaxID=1133364 RepID=A0ABW3UI34_9BACL